MNSVIIRPCCFCGSPIKAIIYTGISTGITQTMLNMEQEEMASMVTTITVFGSSQPLPGSAAYDDAYRVGFALGERGWTVASGGYRGIMEAVSKGAKDAGGSTIGVTTTFFAEKGIAANPYIDTELSRPTYAERLLSLAEIADGYVVMRGGSGTLNEFFHVWELIKNGSLPYRPIVLYGEHWHRIMDVLAAELADEAAFARHLDLLFYAEDPQAVVTHLAQTLTRTK